MPDSVKLSISSVTTDALPARIASRKSPSGTKAMRCRHGRAVRRVFALRQAPERISHAAGLSWTSSNQTQVFAVGHPGPLGLPNRPWAKQLADWRRIGEAVWNTET
jgi:hypothetical protein